MSIICNIILYFYIDNDEFLFIAEIDQ